MTLNVNLDFAADPQHSRDTIMAELAKVLRDSGASVTNIESAIAKTSVSLQEISVWFGGMRELILAMASQLSDSISAPLTVGSMTPDFRQRLFDFGQRMTDIYATSHLRGLYRIAITESIRHTGLARDFHEAGTGRLTQHLADFLRTAQSDGELGSGDPHLLASHFLSPLRATLDEADIFSHELKISPITRGKYVGRVVDLFCRGVNGGRQLC